MPFNHLAGVTDPAAGDEIADWFATFQAWIGVCGWTIESGAGTTNLVISSDGEVGGLTMLFVHVYRGAGGTINRVYFETMDDAVGTHETTNGGYVDSGGVQFNSWMSADKDAMAVIWKTGAAYRYKYAGLIRPFAQTVPDETYHSISAGGRADGQATILRDFNDAWDVDHALTDNAYLDDTMVDRFDNSVALIGVYFNTGVNIGGQLLFITGELDAPAVNPEDTITTGLPGATTDWVVLADNAGIKFALRTAGILPVGMPDGVHFNSEFGVAPDLVTFLSTIVPAFLVGIGWTDLGDPAIYAPFPGRIFYSQGESGDEEIYIGYASQDRIPTDVLYTFVQDDAVPTHRTSLSMTIYMDVLDFPANYWIVGDRNCMMLTIQRGAIYDRLWLGMFQPFAPGLYPPYTGPCLTPYKMVSFTRTGLVQGQRILRDHSGAWDTAINAFGQESASNPNSFDGVTYHVWPWYLIETVAGGIEPQGIMTYHMGSQGGGIASLDTITIAGQVFTVFFDSWPNPWLMRTA